MPFSSEAFIAVLALSGVVILITALMSGLVERASVPQIAVFLLLGAALGSSGLGLLDIGLDSPFLRIVATLALALVLFTDAVTLNLTETRNNLRLASLILGPGTLLAAALIAAIAFFVLKWNWASSLVIAAAIASTDPVMLRGLLRRRDLPKNARLALRLESGLNDIVLLPLLLIAMSFMSAEGGDSMGRLMLSLFILGPVSGIVVGLVSILLLRFARERIGVRRDYESILSLGICFASYAAAEAVHGSGFLAAFASGIMISALDDDLCDCFIEYGETTAEMLLMFTFVLLGGGLIWSGFSILSFEVVLFVALSMFARPFALLLALIREQMDARSRGLIVWFGPRGLSTLLLILIPVFSEVPGSALLFQVCSLVVLLSVVIHGGSIFVIGRKKPSHSHGRMLRVSPKVSLEDEDVLIRTEELAPQMKLADVRGPRDYEESDSELAGAVRLDPDNPVQDAKTLGFQPEDWIALFCT